MNMIFIISKQMEFVGLIHAKSIGLWWDPTYKFSLMIVNCYS